MAVGLFACPFMTYRANRIVAGEPRLLLEAALPLAVAACRPCLMVVIAAVAVVVRRPTLSASPRPVWACRSAAGASAGPRSFVTPAGNSLRAGVARLSASGFLRWRWCSAGGFVWRACGSGHGSDWCRWASRQHCSRASSCPAPGGRFAREEYASRADELLA